MKTNCTFEGCEQPQRSRSLCSGHYMQVYTGKELTPLSGRGFRKLPYEPTHGKASTYSNHKCRCDPCREAWNASCAQAKQRRVGAALPDHWAHGRESSYQYGCRCVLCKKAHSNHVAEKRYAMKAGGVDALREAQGGICACCMKPNPKLVVDHIHGTTHIRGLLCHSCNTGIGKLGDDVEGLMRAVDYLKRNTPQ